MSPTDSSPVTLALSIGCPCGIGPQVSVVAAVHMAREGVRTILVGDQEVVRRAARSRAIDDARLETFDPENKAQGALMIHCPCAPLAHRDMQPGTPTAASGRAQLAWIDRASDLVMENQADALVTGPVSKKAIARSGAPGAEGFAGHTEHLAARTSSKAPIMIFVANEISTALVTTHLAVRDISEHITLEAVAQASSRLAEILWMLGKRPARVAVASLNPHAGEQGMFGDEESRVIVPGIEIARKELKERGIQTTLAGPIGGETAFRQAFDGRFDGVVAMYHDQATIPMKVRCFGEAVNVTAGLSIIRTSVDHGTAYDIAATNQADASSMIEAIRLAARLVRAKRKMG